MRITTKTGVRKMSRIEYTKLPEASRRDEDYFRARNCIFSFKIKASITKTDFKALMRMAYSYDSKDKTGTIRKDCEQKFLELVEKAEKASDKVCKSSHAKSIEKCKEKYSKSSSKECPDCGDYISFTGAHRCWESGLVY
jgi:hypothetical protein